MPANKVVINTEDGAKTLIDLTGDTVAPETLEKGVTAHDKSGEKITGTAPTASEILGDNGFLSLSIIDVTIGANTATDGNQVYDYLVGLVGNKIVAAALLNNPTTKDQLVMLPGYIKRTSGDYKLYKTAYRYRDSAMTDIAITADYLLKVVEGTKYRVWIGDLNTTNIKPY